MPVVIAGMHRSGTSMVATLLHKCGVDLGLEAESFSPSEHHAPGSSGPRVFIEINEALLAYVNATWAHPPVEKASFALDQVPATITTRARESIRAFSDRTLWGWIDPCTSLTLAFWQQLIPGLKVVVCTRNPLDVACSLAQRDHLAKIDSLDLWLAYNRRLLERAEPESTFLTHYDAYFVDPRSELNRLLGWLGITVHADRVEAASAAVVPSLRHYSSTLADLISSGASLDVANLYAQICSQAGPVYQRLLVNPPGEGAPSPMSESGLHRQLMAKDALLRTFIEQVAERERSIHVLNTRLADRQHSTEEITGKMMKGKAWKLVSFLRQLGEAFRVLTNEGTKALVGWIILHFADSYYAFWIRRNESALEGLSAQRLRSGHFENRPLISVIMPVYNPDMAWLRAAIESVQMQSYEKWELCIADDASTDAAIKPFLLETAAKEPRIKVTYRTENGHISRASNSAIELASGDFLCMLDQDDVFYPHALFEVVKRLNERPGLDVIYSDSDLIVGNRRKNPFFKPDWSPELFLSNNYLNHLTVLRKSLVDKVGGFRAGFEGSQDYDLYLRVVGETSSERVAHIARVLYGWRSIPGSAASNLEDKYYAIDAGRKALAEALSADKLVGEIQPGIVKNTFQVRYLIADNPLVSIIIPGVTLGDSLTACLDSIRENAGYDNVELLRPGPSQGQSRLEMPVKTLDWDQDQDSPGMRNIAVRHASGSYLLFLSSKVRLMTPSSLALLLEQAQRDGIGMVTPKILYGESRVYSAGITFGLRGALYAHLFHAKPDNPQSYFMSVPRNCLAVSELCFLVSRRRFEEAGGYDGQFTSAVAANLDLALKLHEARARHLYTPFVSAYNEAPTRETLSRRDAGIFRERWRRYHESDPYYPGNFSRDRADFSY